MDYYFSREREVIRDNTLPVLLFDGKRARQLARSIYSEFGIVSLIVCPNMTLGRSIRRLFSSSAVYMEIKCDLSEGMIADELMRFGGEWEGILPILVPCDNASETLVARYGETLESLFVISSPEDLRGKIPTLSQDHR